MRYGLLSPVDGRPLRAISEAQLRKCYRGRDDEIESSLRSVHRMSPGLLSTVGNEMYSRIARARAEFLRDAHFQRGEPAERYERLVKNISTICEEAAEKIAAEED